MERVAQFKLYLQEVRGELKKVVWPTRKDTTSVTMVVLGMVFAVSIFLWLVDMLLAYMVKLVVG